MWHRRGQGNDNVTSSWFPRQPAGARNDLKQTAQTGSADRLIVVEQRALYRLRLWNWLNYFQPEPGSPSSIELALPRMRSSPLISAYPHYIS
jgi:hypothetical protein